MLVVLLPGRGYPVTGPLLAYAGEAARRAGAEVIPVTWPVDITEDRVRPVVEDILDAQAEPPVLIAKSLGTFAAAVAAERGLPAVWLTPVLTKPEVVAGLRAATARSLIIGGSADPFWDTEIAGTLLTHVIEIPDADHSLHVPGPMASSAAVLGQVTTAIENFLHTNGD